MLDSNILEQIKGVFQTLKADITLRIECDKNAEQNTEMIAFVEDVASCSEKITVEYVDGEGFRFSVIKNGEDTGVSFRGIPTVMSLPHCYLPFSMPTVRERIFPTTPL